MAVVRQPSFAAGELAPALWGRTDSPRYGAGLRLLSDFFVSKHGAAVSRPGTMFLGKAATNSVVVSPPTVSPLQTVVAGSRPRLIPFYFSDTDSTQNYVLEFVEQGVRVWKGGVVVVDYGAIATPYHLADLYKIRYAQSLDTLVLTCAGYPPATLVRGGDTTWTYAAVTFTDPPTKDQSGNPITPDMDAQSFYASDAQHPRVATTWMVTQLLRDVITGATHETGPVRIDHIRAIAGDSWQQEFVYPSAGGLVVLYGATFYVSKDITALPNAVNQFQTPGVGSSYWDLATGWYIWATNTAFSQGSIVKSPSGNWFQARVIIPVPPSHVPPEEDAASWAPYSRAGQNMPLVVDAGLVVYPDKPVTLNLTEAGLPGSSIFISSQVYRGESGIYGFVGSSVGTTFIDLGAEPDLSRQPPASTNPFQVFDAAGGLIRTETPIGCCFFEDRLIFGGTIDRPSTIFASASGDYFNFDVAFIPQDSSALSFAMASRKREVMRSVLGKDKLFAFTNSGMWAVDGAQGPLTPSSIDAHVHVDVGADWPAPLVVGNSVLWVRNQGTGLRAVEFDFSRGAYTGADLSFQAEHLMLGHQLVDMAHAENPWGVTWLVREDGILLSATKGADDPVWGWARHGLCIQGDGTPQKVLSICSIPEDGNDAVYVAVADPSSANAAWILRFSSRLELDDEALQTIAGTGAGLEFNLGTGIGQGTPPGGSPSPSGFVAPGTPICLDAWIFATQKGFASGPPPTLTIQGLDYLNGRAVTVISDGNIIGPFTVNAGAIVITNPPSANNVYVGLPYQPELELLDIADARTRQKAVMNVALEVLAHGKFKAGTSFADLDDQDMPTPDDDEVRLQVRANWSPGGRCCVRQVLPLPLTIRAVSREAAVGEL